MNLHRLERLPLLIVAALLLAACGGSGTTSHTVKFSATTSNGSQMNVTYGINGNTNQVRPTPSPWSKEQTSNGSVHFANLLAQNQGTGSVTCKLEVDGKVKRESTSQGQYAVASCST